MDKAIVGSQIESEIRLRISSGVYASGTYLPSQQKLAKEFHTSQTTIAAALDCIRKNGIIERKPRLGTRIIPFKERSSKGAVGIFYAAVDSCLREPSLILSGIREVLDNNNQHYEFLSFDLLADSCVASLMEKYSGFIFIEFPGEEFLPLSLQLEEKKYPCVVANLEYDFDVSCTWIDHTKATSSAVHTLDAMGHRRILLLAGELDKVFYNKALEGYKTALKELNIEFNQSLVVTVDRYDIDGTEAYKAMLHYLENNPLPTAVVACRDYLAWGACQALEKKNIRIGYDVSVIGFDDITWPGEKSFLTTFNEPAWDLGYVAAEMLIERLIFGWKPVEKREIETSLIIRRSAGPCWER